MNHFQKKVNRSERLYSAHKQIVPTVLLYQRLYRSRRWITGLAQRDGFAAILTVSYGTLWSFFLRHRFIYKSLWESHLI